MQRYMNTGELCVDEMKRLWREELAEHYVNTPRLRLLLLNTPLHFTHEGGQILITFEVNNEVQKLWVESRIIDGLNNLFKEITGKQSIKISVCVEPKTNETIYITDIIPPHIPIEQEISEIDLDIK